MEVSDLFDNYNRRARLYPALLTLLPFLSTVLAWFPDLLTGSAGAALLTVVNACGLLYLLAELSRSQGQRIQRKLLDRWGGFPTTRMLRHGDTALSSPLKARYHAFLSERTQMPLPTAVEEVADLLAADARYSSALDWLREQSRGSDHALVLNENISFGFRRNLLGMKGWGVLLCAVSLIWPIAVIAIHYDWDQGAKIPELFDTLERLEPVHVGAVILAIITLAAWIWVVTDVWVKEAADNYARRLLASCDVLAARGSAAV